MSARSIVRTIAEAIFRPSAFVRTIDRDRASLRDACLATFVWTASWIGLVLALASLVFPVGGAALVAALVLAPLGSAMLAGFAIVLNSSTSIRPDRLDGTRIIIDTLKNSSGNIFWILRTQVTFTPVCAIFMLFLTSGLSDRSSLQLPISAAFLLASGMAAGTILTLTLARSLPAPQARRVIAVALLVIILELAPLATTANGLALILFVAGMVIGIARPLSWLWQSAASLAMAWLAGAGTRPQRWWRAHPAVFDELTLLRLPGLTTFLTRLCDHDIQSGLLALLTVYHHGGQQRAVRSALHALIKQNRRAADVLFALSTQPAGARLLRQISGHFRSVHPLVAAYAQLSDVREHQAWPAVIEACQPSLAAHADHAGFAALLGVLGTSREILRAHEWHEAVGYLEALPAQGQRDPLSQIYAGLRGAIVSWHPHESADPGALVRELTALHGGQVGWSAHLLATLTEHLAFLWRLQSGDATRGTA